MEAASTSSSRPWPCLFLPLLLSILLFTSITHCSAATDTLFMGRSLSGGQTLISKGGKFELGFFSPGSSQKYYIAIWFKQIPQQTIVWVANRQSPLPDASSELKISDKDGNLLLVNHTNIPTWLSNSTSKTSNPPVAVLLDSGNFVLRDSSNSSLVIWQSFDHLTDTLLPGGKFGLNKVASRRHRLISWKSSEDPAPGAYSLQIEEDGASRYFMLWNESRRYWSTGVWDGRRFGFMNDMSLRDMSYMPDTFNYYYVANKIENVAGYSFDDNTTISRGVMEPSGQFKLWVWSKESEKWVSAINVPADQCEVYNRCGSFAVCDETSSVSCTCLPGFRPLSSKDWNRSDWSSGCVREVDLSCTANGSVAGRSQDFAVVRNVQLPSDPQSSIFKGAEECQATCLDDCSCIAYAYNTSGCYKWSGDLLNLRQLYRTGAGGDLFLHGAVPRRADDHKRGLTGIFVACSIGIVVLLAGVLGFFWWRWKKPQLHAAVAIPGSLVPYRYRDLRAITQNFSMKLGGGSFGSVYKGTLPDSSLVAVKKLEGLGQGEKQFRSEVSTIGLIQHVNLVRLHGFCSEGSKRLLVYEFMPNGSLDSYLFGQNSGVLDWQTRYQIALDIAKGLAYLHEKCRECIMHCDIKPENILLDAAFCPKIADFGMAKLIGRDFSRVLTTMRGTIGYLAPEWIQGLAITAKADVYSYGMMMFEIVSGRRNTRACEIADGGYFPLWAAGKIKEDDAISLLDPRLGGNADIVELNRVCRVACWCIQDSEESRPSMGEVVNILEGGFEVNLPPIPRFLQMLLDKEDMEKSDTCDQLG